MIFFLFSISFFLRKLSQRKKFSIIFTPTQFSRLKTFQNQPGKHIQAVHIRHVVCHGEREKISNGVNASQGQRKMKQTTEKGQTMNWIHCSFQLPMSKLAQCPLVGRCAPSFFFFTCAQALLSWSCMPCIHSAQTNRQTGDRENPPFSSGDREHPPFWCLLLICQFPARKTSVRPLKLRA